MDASPQPETGTAEFAKVWLANADKAANLWKFLVYDDTGSLSLSSEGLAFRGASQSLNIPWRDVTGVRRGTQRWAWKIQAVFVGLTCLFVFLGAIADGTSFFVALGIGLLPALAFVLFGPTLAGGVMVPWAVITCRTAAHGDREIWLADAGSLGWSGKRGGTQAIIDAVEARLSPEPRS